MAISHKQRRFVEQYLIDFNATQAAIRAGYSARSAGQQADDLLKKPEIAAAVGEAQEQLSLKTQITQMWVVKKLVELHDKAMREQPRFDKDGNHVGDSWNTGSVAAKALEQLGRYTGGFASKVEMKVTNMSDEEIMTELAVSVDEWREGVAH